MKCRVCFSTGVIFFKFLYCFFFVDPCVALKLHEGYPRPGFKIPPAAPLSYEGLTRAGPQLIIHHSWWYGVAHTHAYTHMHTHVRGISFLLIQLFYGKINYWTVPGTLKHNLYNRCTCTWMFTKNSNPSPLLRHSEYKFPSAADWIKNSLFNVDSDVSHLRLSSQLVSSALCFFPAS